VCVCVTHCVYSLTHSHRVRRPGRESADCSERLHPSGSGDQPGGPPQATGAWPCGFDFRVDISRDRQRFSSSSVFIPQISLHEPPAVAARCRDVRARNIHAHPHRRAPRDALFLPRRSTSAFVPVGVRSGVAAPAAAAPVAFRLGSPVAAARKVAKKPVKRAAPKKKVAKKPIKRAAPKKVVRKASGGSTSGTSGGALFKQLPGQTVGALDGFGLGPAQIGGIAVWLLLVLKLFGVSPGGGFGAAPMS